MRAKNLVGQVFNLLTVTEFVGRDKHGNILWECKCACGNTSVVPTKHLKSGNTRSCGCLNKSIVTRKAHKIAGINAKTHEAVNIYMGAKARCTNKNNHNYKYYGGRGIEFRFKSFLEFIEAVGKRPSPRHSVDRIDNDGHYEPGNVKWATQLEQVRNSRRVKE